jgi:hypothetical protein
MVNEEVSNFKYQFAPEPSWLRRRSRRFESCGPCVLMRRFIMPFDYRGLGLSPTTLSRLGELADHDANSLPEASRRQRVRRATLSETDTVRIRDADTAARADARSQLSDDRASESDSMD